MTSSYVSADSLLAIDIGTLTTRAFLFDVAGGRYRFVAAGSAATTVGTPYHDAGEGVRRALDQLQTVTGRTLFTEHEGLIIPSKPDGSGVDKITATLSAGPPLKVVAVGLLDEVSAESAKHLAATTYAQVVETLSLNDRRKQDARIDTILRTRPDVVIVAGGTEGGASETVRKFLEAIGLACYLMLEDQRPFVLFAGNHELQKEARESLKPLTSLQIAPNIRPTLETEQLEPAQVKLSQIYRQVRARQIPGIPEILNWSEGRLMPSGTAFGRIIRFLSRVYDPAKGVLGIDVGTCATTLAMAFAGKLTVGVHTQLGMASKNGGVLQHTPIENITRWLALEIPAETVRDYVYNKAIYPASLPATTDEMAMEQALARQIIRVAAQKTLASLPLTTAGPGPGLLPWFEPIMATGSVLTHAPTLGQTMLMLLDGLQPTGVTTIVLDQNDVAPALGGAAETNPLLAVQVLESNTFLNLGTVISPVGNARPGNPILRVRLTFDDGNETKVEVKYGTITVLPVPQGQSAHLRLQPLHRFDVGMGGPGRGGRLRVVGGALGVVIDARGRPIYLGEDPRRLRELHKKWLWILGN
jgi:hypothetical protein